MNQLTDFSFAIYDVIEGSVSTINPTNEVKVVSQKRGKAEKVISTLYRTHFDCYVANIDQRYRDKRLKKAVNLAESYPSSRHMPEMPEEVGKQLLADIRDNIDVRQNEDPLEKVGVDGIPDLIVCDRDDFENYAFIEVKSGKERLGKKQVQWLKKYDFFEIKVAHVFDDVNKRDDYVDRFAFDDLLSRAKERRTFEEMEGRPILPREEIARRINNIEVGDQFVFNDRDEPFVATGTGVKKSGKGGEITGIEAKSPKGKTWIFSDNGDWARDWNRERLDWFQKCD